MMKRVFINYAPNLYQKKKIRVEAVYVKLHYYQKYTHTKCTASLRGVTLKSIFTILTTQPFTCVLNSTYKSSRAEEDSHRLFHLSKTAEMWNKEVFWSHQEQSPGCTWFWTWDLATLEPRGMPQEWGSYPFIF